VKEDMNNWKIVNQIAFSFGIVFIVFAIFAALLNFEINSIAYGSNAPPAFIQLSALGSMLVYLLSAVLSFVVAWITMSSAKEKVSEEMPSLMPEPQDETQNEEIEP
jgi:hypothetical protein